MKQKMFLPLLIVLLAVAAAFATKASTLSTQVKLKSSSTCETFTITLDPNCSLSNPNAVCEYMVGLGDIREIHNVTSNCDDPYQKP